MEQVWFSGAHCDVGGGCSPERSLRYPARLDDAESNAVRPHLQAGCAQPVSADRSAQSNSRGSRATEALSPGALRSTATVPPRSFMANSVQARLDQLPEYQPTNLNLVRPSVARIRNHRRPELSRTTFADRASAGEYARRPPPDRPDALYRHRSPDKARTAGQTPPATRQRSSSCCAQDEARCYGALPKTPRRLRRRAVAVDFQLPSLQCTESSALILALRTEVRLQNDLRAARRKRPQHLHRGSAQQTRELRQANRSVRQAELPENRTAIP